MRLQQFAKSKGCNVNGKTYKENGGIYVPLPEYSLFHTVSIDILSLQYEENPVETFLEGAQSERLVNVYERNPHLKSRTLDIHGLSCMVCCFNFEDYYGEHGRNYIEVHHKIPVAQISEEHTVDPETDMVVVCSNCHRMLHRKLNNPLSLEDLKKLISQK